MQTPDWKELGRYLRRHKKKKFQVRSCGACPVAHAFECYATHVSWYTFKGKLPTGGYWVADPYRRKSEGMDTGHVDGVKFTSFIRDVDAWPFEGETITGAEALAIYNRIEKEAANE